MEITNTCISASLIGRRGLAAADVAQVQALANEVHQIDGVELKLNLPRTETDQTDQRAADHVSDLCCYDGGRLIGYAPLDGDDDELEVTIAVLPSSRRRGLFRLLLNAALQEARKRGASRLLLVNYPASAAGAAAVQALNLPYVSSEYRMEVEATALPLLDPGRLRLILVDNASIVDLARLRALSFGGTPKSVTALLEEIGVVGVRYFLAELDGGSVGQVGVVAEGASVYIRAVGIIPEFRRRGHGRQLLAATLRLMVSEGQRHFALDVATDNPQALTLYESCGFRQVEAYDYHNVPLTERVAQHAA